MAHDNELNEHFECAARAGARLEKAAATLEKAKEEHDAALEACHEAQLALDRLIRKKVNVLQEGLVDQNAEGAN